MITLSPKVAFQENEAAVGSFRAIVDSKHFHFALTQALAEYTINHAPTADELRGMRSFLNIFLNLAELEVPMPNFPTKRLEVLVDSRQKAPPRGLPPRTTAVPT
jgi:hypothetical protein